MNRYIEIYNLLISKVSNLNEYDFFLRTLEASRCMLGMDKAEFSKEVLGVSYQRYWQVMRQYIMDKKMPITNEHMANKRRVVEYHRRLLEYLNKN